MRTGGGKVGWKKRAVLYLPEGGAQKEGTGNEKKKKVVWGGSCLRLRKESQSKEKAR